MSIRINTSKAKFVKLEAYLKNAQKLSSSFNLDKYGELGLQALQDATPKDTGLTAASWRFKTKYFQNANGSKTAKIEFYNDNRHDGVPVALVIQYGHATRGGGYVEGIDYINPALQPVFEQLAKDAWEEIRKL